jgi:hypothetical protein
MPNIESGLPLDVCQERLRASSTTHAYCSLLTREVFFPEAIVKVEGDNILIEQKKNFFNPWSGLFKASLISNDSGTTVIKGAFESRPVLKLLRIISWMGVAGGLALTASLVHQLLFTPMISNGVKWVLAGEATFMLTLIFATIAVTRMCEKRYGQMASQEHNFVMEFLKSTLNAQLVDPSDILDDEKENLAA